MFTFIYFKIIYLLILKDDATVVGDQEIQGFRAQLMFRRAMNKSNGCGMIVCFYFHDFSPLR